MINHSNKIFVTGHNGLAGSAFVRVLKENGYNNLLLKTRQELDLLNFELVRTCISLEKPDWIIHCAAKVGGIIANKTLPVEFFLDNITIQNNIFRAAFETGVSKLVFLGSNCIYPKSATIPFNEADLFKGEVEKTNEAYALAKIAGIKLAQFYNSEYNTNFLSVIPTGLYGPNDNYHPEHAHVLPMLLRRFHEAKINKLPLVEIWGSGTPLREFMYSDDMARAGLIILEKYNAQDLPMAINIGPGHEFSTYEIAEKVKEVVGYEGKIVLDREKPDGIARKKLDSSRIELLGFKPSVSFVEGLRKMYDDFLNNTNLRM